MIYFVRFSDFPYSGTHDLKFYIKNKHLLSDMQMSNFMMT